MRALSQELVENVILVEAEVDGPLTSGRQGALWIAFVNHYTLRIVTPVNVEPFLETKIDVKVEPR